MIRRALISVYDKSKIVQFAKELASCNIEIIATGGTAKTLKNANIKVKEVSSLIKSPEILGGRVKTLHPSLFAGILALRDSQKHKKEIKKHRITPIDMVIINLYPFKQTVSKKNVLISEALEQIDIGGVSLIRAGAKNFKYVVVVTNPNQYKDVIQNLKKSSIPESFRRRLALEAFALTSQYDVEITRYFSSLVPQTYHTLGDIKPFVLRKTSDLRYGENPHQKSAFYSLNDNTQSVIKRLHGKQLSYNNIIDIDSGISIVSEFKEPCACVIKHTNPCGVAISKNIDTAYIKAFNADPISAFGGVVVLNRPITSKIAEHIHKRFVEIVAAPNFDKKSLSILTAKKNIILIKIRKFPASTFSITSALGGILMQTNNNEMVKTISLRFVTRKNPSKTELRDLMFAWKIVKHIKSNAAVVVKNNVTLGIGGGQTSRVKAIELACRENKPIRRVVLASDGFMPKTDNVKLAKRYNVSAIIQPGGSIKDNEIINYANKHNISIVFTDIRCFRH